MTPRGRAAAGPGELEVSRSDVVAALDRSHVADPSTPGQDEEVDDAIADAIEALRSVHKLSIEVEGRRFRLVDPVKGDVGSAVLRTLGVVEEATPVSAAAYGATGVAAGVWRSPELYLVRWTKGRRWVVGYRLGVGSRPNHYFRTEGRIPSRFETGNWYGDVPDEVDEAFLEADLLLSDPPFPLPAEPPPPIASVRPAAARKRAAPSSTPRAVKPRSVTTPKPKPDLTRVCPSCRMHKALAQFVAGSDLCVDCR